MFERGWEIVQVHVGIDGEPVYPPALIQIFYLFLYIYIAGSLSRVCLKFRLEVMGGLSHHTNILFIYILQGPGGEFVQVQVGSEGEVYPIIQISYLSVCYRVLVESLYKYRLGVMGRCIPYKFFHSNQFSFKEITDCIKIVNSAAIIL